MSSIDEDKETGIEFVEESQTQDGDLAGEEAKLVRKIDLFLLPTIWLMYLLSYMDVSEGYRHDGSLRSSTSREPILAMQRSPVVADRYERFDKLY